MSGKTYCILGGGGSFGINTALYLLESTWPDKVVGVGRAPLRPRAFTLGVEDCARYEYQQIHAVFSPERLLDYLTNELRPDVIINFAAQGEGAVSWHNSWLFFDTNASALVRLYEGLVVRGFAGHFIHIGTSELYGSVEAPVKEDAPIVPTSPYAASKAAFDMYLLAMFKQGRGIKTTILRPSNCYCPGQLLHRIIPRAVVAGLTGRKLPLHGGGAARKSYMHVRDLARAVHCVSERDPALLQPVYNLGPTYPTPIRTVAKMCAEAVGVKFDDLFDLAPERVGQDSCYWLDPSAAARDLEWAPVIGWGAGLADMVHWARENIDVLRDWSTDYQLRA